MFFLKRSGSLAAVLVTESSTKSLNLTVYPLSKYVFSSGEEFVAAVSLHVAAF